MTVADQMRAFMAMVLCGVCTGAAHDLLTVFRRGAFFTAAADLMLGLMGAAGVIGTALLLRIDPFRRYTLMGVCMGWTIYAITLGTIVRILMKSFINLSKKVTN